MEKNNALLRAAFGCLGTDGYRKQSRQINAPQAANAAFSFRNKQRRFTQTSGYNCLSVILC